MKSIRLSLSTSLMVTLLWGASAGWAGCGSPEKVVDAPAPAKVAWDNADAPEASDESSEASEEKAAATAEKAAPARAATPDPAPAGPSPAEANPTEDKAIDLDALAPSQAKPAPAAEPEPESDAEPEAPTADPAADPVAAELQKRRSEKARKAAKAKKGTPKKRPSASDAEPAPAASAYTGSDPCKAASFSVARVREACSTGGRSAAKRVMKDAIGKATANGQLLKCADCHSNQRNYALKDNAVRDLERWLDR